MRTLSTLNLHQYLQFWSVQIVDDVCVGAERRVGSERRSGHQGRTPVKIYTEGVWARYINESPSAFKIKLHHFAT